MYKFKAIVSRESSDGSFSYGFEDIDRGFLPDNDILIKVHYTGLNFKDSLVAKGHKGIARNYPTIPGVDAAGEIVESKDSNYKVGDKVIVTGHDLGMNTFGGFSEYVSVPADWIVPCPPELTLKEAMIYGTAGVTAGLCVSELINAGISNDKGKVIVTGASGGVGSMAIGILGKLGYEVVASTGKSSEIDWLKSIGASEIIDREELNIESKRPLLSARWVGAIDNVGGKTLENLLKTTGHHGAVCSVGLVASDKFTITVYPFILRGLKLIGIDSAEQELEKKLQLWMKLSEHWKPEAFDKMYREIPFSEIENEIELISKGGQRGKCLVKVIKD
jgi:alcohol dehydrogenase